MNCKDLLLQTLNLLRVVCCLVAAVYPKGKGVLRRDLLFSGACTRHTATGNKCI